MKFLPLLFAFSLVATLGITQAGGSLWQFQPTDKALQEQLSYLTHFQSVQLDTATLLAKLEQAPLEGTPAARQPLVLVLPMPDGSMQQFAVIESPIMADGLARKYAHFKTYVGQGVEDKTANLRISWTSKGFHAYILSAQTGTVYINAVRGDVERCVSFYKRDFVSTEAFQCAMLKEAAQEWTGEDKILQTVHSGGVLRHLRIAIAANGEYTQFHGGTVEDAMSAIVIALNRLNTLFERELALRFTLIAGNESLIFTDRNTDPYTNHDVIEMLGENIQTLNDSIGINNFDLGHVFCTGGGGVASFAGNFCTSQKAGGVTGLPEPEGYEFVIEYVAHEIGHQLGANHTWSNCGTDLNNNQRVSSTAMEPGSGSTIMSYSGLCPGNNIIETSHDNYHAISLIEINNRLKNSVNCYEEILMDNTAPEIIAMPQDNLTIPISTSFELTATAIDAEDDRLTYSWEQFDLGPITGVGQPEGTSPSFRAIAPTTDPTRTLPNFLRLILNQQTPTEVLPTYTRDLTFNLTVRDNHIGSGGVSMERLFFTASEEAGPFRVLYPNNRADVWWQGEEVEVRWDVARTDTFPVNCQYVDIMLSYTASVNFTDTLLARVPNTGSAIVTVPSGRTANYARVKIKAADNIFFDLSDDYFRIEEAVTSTHEIADDKLLQLFPNPATDNIHLQLNTPLPLESLVRIWNVQGQLVQQQLLPAFAKTGVVDVSSFASGLYVVQVQLGGKMWRKKIMID